MPRLLIDAGHSTEELAQFIAHRLDDETLDEIKFERKLAETEGLASEPITTTLVLTLSPIAAAVVVRLMERWLEINRQERNLKLVLDGFSVSDEAGKAAAQVALRHADVSITHGPVPWPSAKA